MGLGEKFDAAKDKVTGKVKETLGKVTHDKSTEAEGKIEHATGTVKDKIADAKAHVKEDLTDRHTDNTEGGVPPTPPSM